MNKELEEILKIYSTGEHRQFLERLADSSKETIISLFTDLLTTYINDRNSSMLREFITVTMAGYKHNKNKIGFNGFKHATAGKPIACEAKPKNLNTADYTDYKAGKRATKPPHLNGNGNFTDYTYSRLKKDIKENPNILSSGFIDGKLIYILEFPFNTKSFVSKLRRQLTRRFPKGKDRSGQFLRSANFTFKDYMESRHVKLIYVPKREVLERYKKYISRDLLEFLLSHAKS
jgi:hypothetical protein